MTDHRNPLLAYLRQSRARVGETRDTSLSLEQQEDAIRQWADRNGYRVEQVVHDHDETGRSLSRPGIMELRERAREGLTVAVWKYDRFARNLIGQELVVEELRALGVEVVSTTEPPGKLPRQLMGSIAEYYSDQLSERIAAIRAAQAARGEFIGGQPPYGYRRRDVETVIDTQGRARERRTGPVVPHPDEAPIVREVGRRFLAGESCYEIARDLHRRGVPRSLGGRWDPSMLRTILTNPFYAGFAVYRGEAVAAGKHEALFDPATWSAIRERMGQLATIRHRSPSPFASWLEGLVEHACGTRMYLTRIRGKTRRDGSVDYYPNFVCRRSVGVDRCGIPRIVISRRKLEAAARACLAADLGRVWSLAEAVQHAEQLAGGDDADRRRRAIADQRRLVERRYAKARELYLENEDDLATWRAEKARYQAEIARLDAEWATVPAAADPDRYRAAAALLDGIGDVLAGVSDHAMRQILEQLGRVRVTPAGVTIVYRAPFGDFIARPMVVGC